MWRGLILAKALEQFLTDVRWGDLDYLLIDMPPGTGDIQMALPRLLPQAEMLVVTTPAKGAQKVAARVADMARRSYLKVLGVVENMSAFVAPDGSRHEIFGAGGGQRLAALDRRAARRRDPDRARGVRGRRRRAARSCSSTPTAPRRRRSARSPDGSSTSCCRRSTWPAARPASSSSWTSCSRSRSDRRHAGAAPRLRRGRGAVRRARRPAIPMRCSTPCLEYGGLAAGDARASRSAPAPGKATRGFVSRAHRSGTRSNPAPAWLRCCAAQRRRRRGDRRSRTGRSRPDALPARVRRAGVALGADRADRVRAGGRRVLAPGGTIALFWNRRREWDGGSVPTSTAGSRGTCARAVPRRVSSGTSTGHSTELEAAGRFDEVVKQTFAWTPGVHDRGVRRDDGHALEPPHARRRDPGAPARRRRPGRRSARRTSRGRLDPRRCITGDGASRRGSRPTSRSCPRPCPRPSASGGARAPAGRPCRAAPRACRCRARRRCR